MSGAELLPLLSEIEKRGGPLRVFSQEFRQGFYETFTAWTVNLAFPSGNAVRSIRMVEDDTPIAPSDYWTIVGALMENEERLALSYRADYAEWRAVVIDDPLVHGDPSPVDAVCRAWLAAHPEPADV